MYSIVLSFSCVVSCGIVFFFFFLVLCENCPPSFTRKKNYRHNQCQTCETQRKYKKRKRTSSPSSHSSSFSASSASSLDQQIHSLSPHRQLKNYDQLGKSQQYKRQKKLKEFSETIQCPLENCLPSIPSSKLISTPTNFRKRLRETGIPIVSEQNIIQILLIHKPIYLL